MQEKIDILINLYEVGCKGFRRDCGYVVSRGGLCPALRAREQGDMAYVINNEKYESELKRIWALKKMR